jgi:hypothetical protein
VPENTGEKFQGRKFLPLESLLFQHFTLFDRQGLGVGKVQEFETVHCPTLRSYEKAAKFPNTQIACILLTPC